MESLFTKNGISYTFHPGKIKVFITKCGNCNNRTKVLDNITTRILLKENILNHCIKCYFTNIMNQYCRKFNYIWSAEWYETTVSSRIASLRRCKITCQKCKSFKEFDVCTFRSVVKWKQKVRFCECSLDELLKKTDESKIKHTHDLIKTIKLRILAVHGLTKTGEHLRSERFKCTLGHDIYIPKFYIGGDLDGYEDCHCALCFIEEKIIPYLNKREHTLIHTNKNITIYKCKFCNFIHSLETDTLAHRAAIKNKLTIFHSVTSNKSLLKWPIELCGSYDTEYFIKQLNHNYSTASINSFHHLKITCPCAHVTTIKRTLSYDSKSSFSKEIACSVCIVNYIILYCKVNRYKFINQKFGITSIHCPHCSTNIALDIDTVRDRQIIYSLLQNKICYCFGNK